MRNILRLLPYLKSSRRLLALTLALGLLSQAAQLLVPKVIEHIIRQALGGAAGHIAGWAVLVLLLSLAKGGLGAAESILGIRVGQQVLRELRQDIYSHVIRLRLRFFDGIRSGDLLSRVTADLDPIDGFLSWGLRLVVRNTLLFVGALAICLSMNWRLTLVSLAFFPLISGTAFIIGVILRPAWQLAREHVGAFSSSLEETLSGIRVVRMYVQEEREAKRLAGDSAEVRDRMYRANRIDAAYYPLTGLWAGAAGVAVLAYGGLQVINGQLDLAQYVAFEMYVMFLMVPMRMLGWMVSGIQRSAVGAERILGLLDEEPETSVTTRPTTLGSESVLPEVRLRGAVRFDRVTFGYREGETVLSDLSLDIEEGEVVGILGPTGGGKSALVALIPRFYDPQQGRVLIDGRDVRDYDVRWLRRQIGVVFQEPFLFSGTVRENIAFGKPDATLEEVREAARQAALADFIEGLEKGYDTVIGERGLNLSGGQQQRMTIARTLLLDPRILILDDATSSVDAHTEFQIQQALTRLMRTRTSFVIAQRASSVWHAHRVIVIDQGRIVEQGTPGELSALEGGHYRRLLDVQRALGGAGRAIPERSGDARTL